MRLLSRVLAVVAASGIWLCIPSATQAASEKYPVWPSFLSTGCTALQGPSGSTTVVCGQGAFLLTQVNSGYECNQLDINVTTFNAGPFTATGTVNSGSQSNSISINDTGNYYMQFPGFLVNNLITIQISATDSGSMTIGYVATNPCPVATRTDTPNPSFTATNTPVPVTGTPTPIPTYTPLPTGHNTFTPTPTPDSSLTTTPTTTPTPSETPFPGLYNCGDPTFPLKNCGMGDNISFGGTFGSQWYGTPHCYNPGDGNLTAFEIFSQTGVYGTAQCKQDVIAHATGNVYMTFDYSMPSGQGGNSIFFDITGSGEVANQFTGQTPGGLGQEATINLGPVSAGVTYTWYMRTAATDGLNATVHISDIWVGSTGGTPLPTVSPTATYTPVPGTATNTGTPTLTPVPIPGAMSTSIPTSTECPGGCAVAALTSIPALATRVMVDTSPFSQLQHLSLARNGCTAFGYVQVPYPVIHGTPALGSTTPLSITWTLPVTHDWDNTQPFSNTAIEPCAMSEIPTFVWDFTYWLSVFACSVVFIMWLIGVIGRLSGDENING